MGSRARAAGALPNLIRTLRKEAHPKPTTQQLLPSLRRAFSLYDQINLIDNVPDDQLRFQRYTENGFTVNGVDYEGSLLCVGNMLMSWAPSKFSDVTPDSLSIFQLVRPIPEILILGCGRNIEPVDPELRRYIRSTGMKLEAVDSEIFMNHREAFPPFALYLAVFCGNKVILYMGPLTSLSGTYELALQRNAISTYNILNEEGRIVAAALLPYGAA